MIYDLMILGGGPGGYLSAERAAGSGLRTLLVEQAKLGGVCLNEGCIPTKTLLHSAGLLESCANGAVYGVTCENPVLHHGQVLARKDKVVRKLTAAIRSALKASGAEMVTGTGSILGRAEEGFQLSVDGTVYTGRQLILATGSQPILPPIPGLNAARERGFALTSGELLAEQEVPRRLVILGGGVIGLEMAAYFTAAGSAVTIVELLPKIAGGMEDEISALVQKHLEKQGVTGYLGARAAAFADGAVVMEQNGASVPLPCDKALLSVGRGAVTQGFGLEHLGAAVDRAGITVDEQCRTSVPGVYAVGDCNGRSMLAHTAYRQAEVAVNTILGRPDRMRYRAIPNVIYTHPEAASVGLTAEAARVQGIDTAEVRLSMNYAGRYVAENERGDGICKLVFDRVRQTMIGAHILGGPASEFIVNCGMLIDLETPLSRMKELVFPHPTVSEIIREGIFQVNL